MLIFFRNNFKVKAPLFSYTAAFTRAAVSDRTRNQKFGLPSKRRKSTRHHKKPFLVKKLSDAALCSAGVLRRIVAGLQKVIGFLEKIIDLLQRLIHLLTGFSDSRFWVLTPKQRKAASFSLFVAVVSAYIAFHDSLVELDQRVFIILSNAIEVAGCSIGPVAEKCVEVLQETFEALYCLFIKIGQLLAENLDLDCLLEAKDYVSNLTFADIIGPVLLFSTATILVYLVVLAFKKKT